MILNNQSKIQSVTLRVTDLQTMTDFYTQTIGLNIVAQSPEHVQLGVDNQTLIHLTTSPNVTRQDRSCTGLYHLALLVPDAKYLGQLLYHFSEQRFQLTGGSDHIFSQALYMNDPEGNGIEIYADRPRSEWTIYDDGTIESGTYALDVEGLIKLVGHERWQGMPSGTVMGHVHLQINDMLEGRKFYLDFLGYELKTDMEHAIFISKNGYHHDLGVNIWTGKNTQMLPESMTGLVSLNIKVDNLDEVKKELLNQSVYTYIIEEKYVLITDKAGIKVKLFMI